MAVNSLLSTTQMQQDIWKEPSVPQTRTAYLNQRCNVSHLSYYLLNSQDQFSGWDYLPLLLDALSMFAFAVPSFSFRCQFVLKSLTSLTFLCSLYQEPWMQNKKNKTKLFFFLIIKDYLGIIIAIVALEGLPRKGIRNQIQ